MHADDKYMNELTYLYTNNACYYIVPYISLLAVAIAYSQSNCSSCAKTINAQKTSMKNSTHALIRFQDITTDFNFSMYAPRRCRYVGDKIDAKSTERGKKIV